MFRNGKSHFAAIAVLLGVLGCGGGDDPSRPARVPAQVTVTYRGTPVEGAHVTLLPVEGGGKPAFGQTARDGVARLRTFSADDGAIPGRYRITIRKTKVEGPTQNLDPQDPAALAPDPSAPPSITIDLLPSKYVSAATSGLEATVSQGSKNEFTCDLTD